VTDLLSRLHATLAAASADDGSQPDHARAYAQWIERHRLADAGKLHTLADEAAAVVGAARQTAHAAVLGYAVSVDASYSAAFQGAVDWLSSRSYFVPGRPLQFEVDGLALLGVAVGIAHLPEPARSNAKAWFLGILRQQRAPADHHEWNDSLVSAARHISGADSHGPISPDLIVALQAKGLIQPDVHARTEAWGIISSLDALSDGLTRASTQRAALTFLLSNAATLQPDAITVEDTIVLLNGLNRSLRRWAWESEPRTPRSAVARWNVENEYHVQAWLWSVLAPIFPDLDDEEWLKSLGHHQPRGDLAIPSLQLIVEAKFLRAGGPSVFSKVIQEVAADASTYLLQDSPYRHLVAVVWDDIARTEEHAELRKGLLRINGVRDAIIISRPSRMVRGDRESVSATPAGVERALKPKRQTGGL